MTYAITGFGAVNNDASKGCGTTADDRKALQAILNKLGYTDGKGKALTEDGKWGPASGQAMQKALAALIKEKKIKKPTELCNVLRTLGLAAEGAPAQASQDAAVGKAAAPASKKGKAAPAKGAGDKSAPAADAPAVAAPAPGAQPASEPVKAEASEAPGMSRNMKLALAFGGLAVGGLLIGSVLLRKPAATAKANKRRLGHGTAPAKYRRTGATRPSDYAWPEGFMYPIHDAKHVRSAASRFAQHKGKLPPAVRKKVAKRINQAKKRFGIGGGPIRAN